MRCRSMWAVVVIVLALAGVAHPGRAHGASPVATPVAGTLGVPDSPVGEQLAWLIGALNGEQAAGEAELAARFVPAVLDEVPPAVAAAMLGELAAAGPFDLAGFVRPPEPTQAAALLSGASGMTFLVVLSVEEQPPHRIAGVSPIPAPPLDLLPPVAPETLAGRFDVGGRELALSCSGASSPTVVLEAGYGDAGAIWFAVQNGLAPETRVCTYDRANVFGGASDPAPSPRTAANLAADLAALLDAAEVPGPYVLVGHSFGGLVARVFAAEHPDRVAGLVLVDAVHEDRQARSADLVSSDMAEAARQMAAAFPDFEGVDLEASWEQARTARDELPQAPLVVLAAGRGSDPSLLPPGWPIEAETNLHRELQGDLATLVPGGRLVMVEDAGHYIQLERPDLVIEAIRSVLADSTD